MDFSTRNQAMDQPTKKGFAKDIDQLTFAMNAAGIGIWELDTETNTVLWDDRCRDLFGLATDTDISYKDAIQFVHPEDLLRVDTAVQEALQGVNGGVYESTYRTIGATDQKLRWVNFSGTAYFDATGQVTRFGGVARDVTEQMTSRQATEESEAKLRGVIAAAPAAIGLFVGRDLVIQHPNQAFIDIVGKGPYIDGLPLREAMPELITEGQPFLKILDDVYTTGVPFISPASLVKIVQNGFLNDNYYNISYTPLRNAAGEIYGILDIAIDVTAQVQAQEELAATSKALQQSEAESRQLFAELKTSEQVLRNTIAQAPVAIFLFRGEEMRIEQANASALAMIRRTSEVIGQPLLQAVPELAGTSAYTVFQEVYRTGQAQYGHEVLVPLERDGVLEDRYFNFTYTPLLENGQVVGVIDIASEVTEAVRARQTAEQSEKKLKEAIELAELGTWSYDIGSRTMMTSSSKMMEWYGIDELDVPVEEIIRQVVVPERDWVRAAFNTKYTADQAAALSGKLLNYEYSIINRKTGQRYTLHTVGKTVCDADGRPVRVEGTTRDVTLARSQQTALEQEVQHRTEVLAITNEELAQANMDLKHSNEELSQYAYVASHDLQEPLRKIQVFSEMMTVDPLLGVKNKELLSRINHSSARMAALIRDLLNFSRLLKSDLLFTPTNLNAIVAEVWNDFELIAKEKSATIQVSPLPILETVSLQMNQLFYNLISNALKFTQPATDPRIVVESKPLDLQEVRNYIQHPLPFATYHQICIQDNGIGFEAKYHNQIFEVFKRLHTREVYPGSGIGLALCRRIVANHKGTLYTQSTPGEGSTFCLILPDKQKES
ncbi:MAG: PAS domain S-box protein [Sphingobacteriales bacterium]|nr:MAG: PAS domain S-box protein [Sphingobacteriales bacterium]